MGRKSVSEQSKIPDAATSAEPKDGVDSSSRQPAQSRVISRILTPALRLWLRSQLEQVEDLQIAIAAGDRQLLSGEISQVVASASKAIYRGLHFSQIRVVGQSIQTNLKQVLRGKPLRLLTSFPVTGDVCFSEADLNASLNAPLLANAVAEFLLPLLQPEITDRIQAQTAKLHQVHVRLAANELTFTATLITPDLACPVAIRTGLTVKNGNLLKLEGFQQQRTVADLAPSGTTKTSFTIPLGSDVHLETLTIQPGQLICRGRVMVLPGERQ